jgi:hypothetical protein
MERARKASRLLAKPFGSLAPLFRQYRLRDLMIGASTKSLRCFVLLSVVLLAAAEAHPQNAPCAKGSRSDCPRAVVFFHNLRAALIGNDRKAVAKMMEYPFLTSINHKKVHISTPTKFLQHFDEVFDKGVRCEIAGASDEDVWGNSRGFTIKLGAIWFDDLIPPGEEVDSKSPDFWVEGSFKVITVNNDTDYPCPVSGKAGE